MSPRLFFILTVGLGFVRLSRVSLRHEILVIVRNISGQLADLIQEPLHI